MRFPVLFLSAVVACDPGSARDGMTVRDSAGITIVELPGELLPTLERWRYDPEPLTRVARSENEDAYLFTRILLAAPLPGEELLVADRGTTELRVFDAAGRFTRRIGRIGSGPGEFQSLYWVGVDPSGAISVWDGHQRRIIGFSPDGAPAGSALISPPAGVAGGIVIGRFADGSVLARAVSLANPQDLTTRTAGVYRDTTELYRAAPDGSASTPAGRIAGDESLWASGMQAMTTAPFGLRTVIAVGDSGFHVGTQDAWEIRTHDPGGSLRRIVRRAVTREPLPEAVRAAWNREQDERLARPVQRRPAVLELLRYRDLPATYPAFGDLLLDHERNLWVGRYRPHPARDTLTSWIVLGPDGMPRAAAELPGGQIMAIGTDRVALVQLGEDDLPSVRVYRILKPR